MGRPSYPTFLEQLRGGGRRRLKSPGKKGGGTSRCVAKTEGERGGEIHFILLSLHVGKGEGVEGSEIMEGKKRKREGFTFLYQTIGCEKERRETLIGAPNLADAAEEKKKEMKVGVASSLLALIGGVLKREREKGKVGKEGERKLFNLRKSNFDGGERKKEGKEISLIIPASDQAIGEEKGGGGVAHEKPGVDSKKEGKGDQYIFSH